MTAGLATALVAGLVPGVAQAHHVASSGAQCTLVANVPTITAWASFASFADNNKPIGGELDVDAVAVQTIRGFTFPGQNGTWHSAQVRATPGRHHISGAFTWPNQNNANGRFDADVNCPAPPPPPAPPAPPAPPTVTPPAPPVTPPSPAQVASPPQGAVLGESESGQCVPKKLGRYRITVTPKHQLHGLVTFHLHGPGVSHVRWYVDTRRAGLSGKPWEFLRQHGRAYGIFLWARQRWGKHLWGRHTIEVRFRVKDSCGNARAVRVQRLYFNHDPRPDDPIFAHPGR